MKRMAMWGRWASVMAVVAAVLVGVPEVGWGQKTAKQAMGTAAHTATMRAEILSLRQAGKYDKAIELAERVLSIRQNLLRPDDPDIATSQQDLAELYLIQGDHARAEPLLESALAIREKVYGFRHADVADLLNTLSGLHFIKGDYRKAIGLSRQALDIWEAVLKPNDPDIANGLNSLAVLYEKTCDYEHAEPLYLRALDISRTVLGPEHEDVANQLNNLGVLYAKRGDHARAESLYRNALAIWEKNLGPEHPELASPLNNLAQLYKEKRDYVQAEALFERALRIRERAFGSNHPDLALAISNIAGLHADRGDYMRAEMLYRRALGIREKVLGSRHPSVALSLNQLASLYDAMGNYEEAHTLYQRALEIWENSIGPDHEYSGRVLHNLGWLSNAKDDYEEAERYYRRALAIFEKSLGSEHLNVAVGLQNLAIVLWSRREIPLAVQLNDRAMAIRDLNALRQLTVGTAEQKRAYLEEFRASTYLVLSWDAQIATGYASLKHLALRTILRRKGLTLDAMANSFGNLRQRLPPEQQAKFDEWRSFTAQYSALVQQGPGKQPIEAYRALLQGVNEKRKKLENELSFASKDLQTQLNPVTIEQVQNALPKDAALVELFRYQPFNPKAKGNEARWGNPRFVAYVLHPNGHIDFADLGEAKPIEEVVQAWRDDLSHDATDPKPNARRLHQLVMAPVQKLLGNTRRIYLSPDGDLNLVPFDALVDEKGQYLVESFAITYLPTGRDLVRRGSSIPSRQAAIVFAGPQYDAGKKPETSPPRQFAPLLHAQTEADAIAQLMPGTMKREWAEATEAAIKKLHAPKFLHISTHGFFEKDLSALQEPPRDAFQLQVRPPPPVENALLRSGLALAGANRGGLENEDGLLTALEAAQLDLWGTKLVVLSACNTGNGHVENGDGVYGLRRAIDIAGAETVVMSLWQVKGGATTALMKSYYQGLSAGGGRAEALRQAQLGMLHSGDHAHPYYWAGFIVSGDDRSMEGRPVEPTFGRVNPGCGRCAMGASEETGASGWIGLVLTAALLGLRRRSACTSEGRPTSLSCQASTRRRAPREGAPVPSSPACGPWHAIEER